MIRSSFFRARPPICKMLSWDVKLNPGGGASAVVGGGRKGRAQVYIVGVVSYWGHFPDGLRTVSLALHSMGHIVAPQVRLKGAQVGLRLWD